MSTTALNIPAPKKKNTKGIPPQRVNVPNNLRTPESREIKDLNFKVSADFKREFQQLALNEGKSGKELLMDMFLYYKNKAVN